MEETMSKKTRLRLQCIALQGMRRLEEQAATCQPNRDADRLDELNSFAQVSLEAIREIADWPIVQEAETIRRQIAAQHEEAQRFAAWAKAA